MKEYQAENIRNFAVVGHGGCGKTILSEAILANGGVINRIGSVESGNTVSDYHSGEKDRQISIHATPLYVEWDSNKFNFIDAPGYLDFIGEALGAISVSDMALVVVHAVSGVEVGTEQVWGHATKFGIPKVIVVNGLDREHTKFDEILKTTKNRFGKNVFPMQLPVNAGPGFNQVLDVLRKEIITYKTDGSGQYSEEPAEGEWESKASELHEELIEYVAESDDSLLETFFEKGGLSEEEMRGGIHAAVQNQTLIPLFCCSAQTNVGVPRLMDFISKYGSSPTDRGIINVLDSNGKDTEVSINDSETVVQVFKTISEAHVGDLSFFRVYSGKISAGSDLFNTSKGQNERIGQLSILNGKERTSVHNLNAGDMGAVVKLKNTHTSDTLCSSTKKVSLPKTQYPNPNIHSAVELHSKGDEEKLAMGLSTLHEEDPTFVYRVDSEVRQTIISGQGELHLKISIERLQRRFNIKV
ncbi:MAG: GTP-binding protein, partial [Candidatus Marinimicrobia bacterium]|nr:GTP-binding protein [Candidatus Neomarinimicrobiota bacterium]